MIYVSFLFMGNLRFADKLGGKEFVVDEGYLPLLNVLKLHPEVRSHICSSGFTTLRLQERFPAVINGIREGIAEERVRIGTNGFEHVLLPTLSVFAQEKNVQLGVELDRSAYGQQPTGFWPSDGCWDSTAAKPLRDSGVEWVYYGNIASSNPGRSYFNDWTEVEHFMPFTIQGPEGSSIVSVHPLEHNNNAGRDGLGDHERCD